MQPIGVVRSPFVQEREDRPRGREQPPVVGTIELDRALAHAVGDLERFQHVWVLAWMDRAPRFRLDDVHTSARGVFATRSPFRPNPIALSVMELLKVEGAVLHVRGVDLLDGTPVLDVKPYLPSVDALPRSRVTVTRQETSDGRSDETSDFEVRIGRRAAAQLAWLEQRGTRLEPAFRSILEVSPFPHPYRRIAHDRTRPGGFVVAIDAWRVAFHLDRNDERVVHVTEVRSGYRPLELASHPLHRALMKASFPPHDG